MDCIDTNVKYVMNWALCYWTGMSKENSCQNNKIRFCINSRWTFCCAHRLDWRYWYINVLSTILVIIIDDVFIWCCVKQKLYCCAKCIDCEFDSIWFEWFGIHTCSRRECEKLAHIESLDALLMKFFSNGINSRTLGKDTQIPKHILNQILHHKFSTYEFERNGNVYTVQHILAFFLVLFL